MKLLHLSDLCFGIYTVLWGCHLLVELGSAKHHPQKRHIPRQAGQHRLEMGVLNFG